MAQVERYIKDEVREHYLLLKLKYVDLWDKVFTTASLFTRNYIESIFTAVTIVMKSNLLPPCVLICLSVHYSCH